MGDADRESRGGLVPSEPPAEGCLSALPVWCVSAWLDERVPAWKQVLRDLL